MSSDFVQFVEESNSNTSNPNTVERMLMTVLKFGISSCKTPVASGVFRLQFPNIKVLCETEFMDGGWLVIQQRVDITTSFDHGWTEYRNGFGAVGKNEDFWLGLESIHQITTSGQYELAVEFKDKSKKYGYARVPTTLGQTRNAPNNNIPTPREMHFQTSRACQDQRTALWDETKLLMTSNSCCS
ncbi:ficolin-1-like [Culex pipiens pallens]|uniref:ficolin-1-like n=1 Tax=Culex pipiens pallens TaxID=42434 RepID=UPI0019545338|nr:ficolin-1-like [Culex pipiens pallens]